LAFKKYDVFRLLDSSYWTSALGARVRLKVRFSFGIPCKCSM
jgi:hypothetical protein